MLINLSSLNEPDPAKFKNDFSDSMMISKMSYICLVKAQIIRIKETKQIVIAPNTILYFRWMAYDVGQIDLNFNGTANIVLNVSQFIQEINAVWGALGFPAGYVVEALLTDPPGPGSDEKIIFKIVANTYEEGVIDFRWKDEVYAQHGTNSYFTTKFGQCRNDAGALIAFSPAPNAVNGAINALFSQAGAMALGVIWDTTTRTTPPNQLNGSSFGMLTTEILSPTRLNGYTPMQFFINQQNINLSINFGISTSTGTIYNSGPYIGHANYNPNNTNKSNILSLEFDSVQGRLSNKVYNTDSTQFETNLVDYDPGDYFEIYSLVDHEGAIDMVDPQRAFYMNVNHYKTGGLILAYQGNLGSIGERPGSNNFFLSANTTQPTNSDNVMNNMCHAYDLEHMKDKYYKQDSTNLPEFLSQWQSDMGYVLPAGGASFLTNSVIGSRVWSGRKGQTGASPTGAGWVYNQSLGRPATKQFMSAYVDGNSDLTQWRYATGTQGFNNQDGVQRANGSAVEIPNTFRAFTTPLIMSAPTFIACSINFNVLAESMIPATQDANIRTIIGGDAQVKLLEIQLNQANTALPGGWDIRVTQADGSLLLATLEDAGGNRINFRGSNNTTGYTYNFLFSYTGSNNNTLQCQVVQCQKAPGVASTITLFNISGGGSLTTTQPLMPWNSIGGVNPLTDTNLNSYNDYSPLTYICNIRVFQKNLRTANTNATWNIERSAMEQAFQIIPAYVAVFDWWEPNAIPSTMPPAISFYPYATSNFVVPTIAQGTQDQYNNVGFQNSTQNLGVFISKGDTTAPTEPIVPVLNNLWVPAGQILRDISRVTNLSSDAYAGIGQGLVETDIPVGSGSADMLDFLLPEPDVNGNIIQIPRVLAPNPVPPNDWTSRIECDTEISQTDNEAMNIEITNLPHRTLNGANKSYDKTIYQMPMIQHTEEVGNDEIIECTPPSKVWIPLNNAMEIPLNKLDVQISSVDGKKIQNLLRKDTNITIQIEDNINLLN